MYSSQQKSQKATMTPKKPPPPSGSNMESKDDELKIPFKKTSPNAKYKSPKQSLYAKSDVSESAIQSLKVSTPPTDRLAKFGIKLRKSSPATKLPGQKLVYLKCGVINTGEDTAIAFRFDPIGSYVERIMYEEIFKFKKEWTRECNFDDKLYFSWFHHNEAQTNSNNYAVRLFVIRTAAPVVIKQDLFELCQFICQQLNQIPSNNSVITVDDSNFIWTLPDAVWADIIGDDKAYKIIMDTKGNPTATDNFYARNKPFIDSYFRSGTYTIDLARKLRAPEEEIHPSERIESEFHQEME